MGGLPAADGCFQCGEQISDVGLCQLQVALQSQSVEGF